jgi:2-phosphosulfolactate phosphatase
MRIEREEWISGARRAQGLVIVIDVFRACSLIALALAAGARRIVPMAGIAEAQALKARHPDWLLLGERDARPIAGFEGGNSPTALLQRELAGRTIIHTTHAGTQGLTAAYRRADSSTGLVRVLTGAFVNLAATAAYARRAFEAGLFDRITLVAMGQNGVARCDEDELCADYLAAALRREEVDANAVRPRLRVAPAAAKFFDPAASWAPEADFDYCTRVDVVNFAVGMAQDADGCVSLSALT